MGDVLKLRVAGQDFDGWKSIRVMRSLEHCAGGFRLGVSEASAKLLAQTTVRAGQACEVLVSASSGDERVITGYVDAVQMQLSATAHEVEVSGRDKTADLVDCSAVVKAGQWKGQRIEQVAALLAKPFGISVSTEVDTGKPLTSFAIQAGETVFEAIERAARIRALLLVADGAGNLVLTRAGTKRVETVLELGENLLELHVGFDLRDRFSHYVVVGQAPASDFLHGKYVSQIKALAGDAGLGRYRPKLITNDQPDVAATLQQRALWEATVRAGRSIEVQATVQGWRHAAGASGLWEPNRVVRVRAPAMQGLDHELLITTVEFSLDERGTTTKLRMTRPDAFSLLPMKEGPGGPYWDGAHLAKLRDAAAKANAKERPRGGH